MFEYLKIEHIEYLGKNRTLELKHHDNCIEYKFSCINDTFTGTVNNIGGFVQAVEAIDIPSLDNEYNYDGIIIDGMRFTLKYKEFDGSVKAIKGEYYPDEIIELLSEIELIIPDALFFPKFDFFEWYKETIEEMELENVDERDAFRIKIEFDNAPTWAKKNQIADRAVSELVEKYGDS